MTNSLSLLMAGLLPVVSQACSVVIGLSAFTKVSLLVYSLFILNFIFLLGAQRCPINRVVVYGKNYGIVEGALD